MRCKQCVSLHTSLLLLRRYYWAPAVYIKQTTLFVNFLTETKTAPIGFQRPSRRTSYDGVHTALPGIVLLESVKEFLIMPTGIL